MPGFNIVLVNPPFVYFPNLVKPKYNYCRPPLGLCYVASYLKKHRPGRDRISIIDTLVENRPSDYWVNRIAALEPDIVGLSIVTPTATESAAMARELRKRRPGVTLMAGGPHATIMPEDLVDYFDFVVAGEGEQTFKEIVECIERNDDFDKINGIVFRRGDGIKKTPSRDLISPLDNIPTPARDLLETGKYYHSFPYNHRGGSFTTMFTCRGCPHNCYFCGNKALWNGKIRFHSTDYVRCELERLVAGDVRLVFIDDDDFLASKKRALEICEIFSGLRGGLKWICHACVSSIDDEALRAMKRAGCVEMQVGVESGNENILKKLSKCDSKELIAEKFRLLKKRRVNAWGTFIIGHDGDTRESVMDTINFAKIIDPTYASFIILLPFPGTLAFDTFREKGYLKTTDWADYTWHGDPVFETPELSAAELVKFRALAQKSFYLRPGKILRLIAHTILSGSFREMMRNFYAWMSVVLNGGKKTKKQRPVD